MILRRLLSLLLGAFLSFSFPFHSLLSRGVGSVRPGGSILILSTGDSITEGFIEGVVDFENRFTTVLERTLIEQGFTAKVANAGRGGETSVEGAMRFARDLSLSCPDVVTILFGANDLLLTGEGTPEVSAENFGGALRFMVRESRASAAVPVLLTLVPIDAEKFYVHHDRIPYESRGGIETIWQDYDSAIRRVAREENVAVLDIEELFRDSLGISLGEDGTHPSARGHESIGVALSGLIAGLELEEGQENGEAAVEPLADCYAYPNPFRPADGALLSVHMTIRRPGRVGILVFDPSGRKVASIPQVDYREAGQHWFVWDGRGSHGDPAAPGVYLFSLLWVSQDGGERTARSVKVAVLR